jgi:hypothetical protein
VWHEKSCPNRPPPGENDRQRNAKVPLPSVRQTFFTLKNVGNIKSTTQTAFFRGLDFWMFG